VCVVVCEAMPIEMSVLPLSYPVMLLLLAQGGRYDTTIFTVPGRYPEPVVRCHKTVLYSS